MSGIIRRGMRLAARVVLAGVMGSLLAESALAAPARIILLRHGEKQNAWALCPVGVERSQALRAQYLGKDAQNSLFRPGETPKAFFAITLHSLELITPTAISWAQPVITYAVAPGGDLEPPAEELNTRTRQAAQDILTDPRWTGATVVVAWEHDHIAKAPKTDAAGKSDKSSKSDKHAKPEAVAPVTFFDLLGLGQLPDVPTTWPGETYDYFWIIDLDPQSGTPTAFHMEKQAFTGAFANLPQNDWGAPNGLTAASTCIVRGSGKTKTH